MLSEHWTDRLSEYVDGELTHDELAACEAHLVACAECRAVVEDLRAVAGTAAALPSDDLRRDLWPGILSAITPETTVIPITRRRPWYNSLPGLAAAAALVAVVSGGSVWLAMRSNTGVPVPSSVATTTTQPSATLTPAAARAEATYDAAVSDLRKVLDAGRGRLDSTTLRVLERNLAIIDSAVADAQRAVARDPQNAYLNAYLARTMRRKVDLLRQAATLARAET
ncbi:MAG TPA: zf-HC2 domain-containing protein [Gemmatimonadales bacterium]|jgi:negative regulator of sigma E activity|nr:zf-HC2 domain-containing protein [Gemmatimonadales bacterium]